MNEKQMTPEETDALKAEVIGAVEDVFSKPVTSKEQTLKAVAEALSTLESPKDLGGMGMNQGMGDMENMSETGAEKGIEE